MSNLLERLRSAANSNELRHEAADEIERLCAEVADLTGANVLLHGIVSNREEEIAGLRAQLASARKALTQIEQISDLCISAEYYTAEDALNHLQGIRNVIKKFSLSDEKST